MTQHSAVTKKFYNKTVAKLRGIIRDKDKRIDYLERNAGELRQQVKDLEAQQSEVVARAVEWGFLEGFNGALPLKEMEVKSAFRTSNGSSDLLERHKRHLAKLHAEQYANQLREQSK